MNAKTNGACPVCHGDCADANPPVIFCPMVERAMLAYEAEVDGDVYSPNVPFAAMRAALIADLSQEPQ